MSDNPYHAPNAEPAPATPVDDHPQPTAADIAAYVFVLVMLSAVASVVGWSIYMIYAVIFRWGPV